MFLSGFCVLKALTKRVLGSHKMAGKTTVSKARGLQKNWASPEDQKYSPDLGGSGGDMLRQKCGGSQRRALSVLPWHVPRCLEREWPERNERERERDRFTQSGGDVQIPVRSLITKQHSHPRGQTSEWPGLRDETE